MLLMYIFEYYHPDCPAGRFDNSNDCQKTCPTCLNGGVCNDVSGLCICAPGFQGDNYCQTGTMAYINGSCLNIIHSAQKLFPV